MSFITFKRILLRKFLGEDGIILPYSLLLLILVMMTGAASTSLFLSKYQYLTNMGKVYERKVSIAHGVLLGIERGTEGTVQLIGPYGQTKLTTTQLTEEEMIMEITYQSSDKVFKPVSVVYNKETKHITDWK